MRSDACIMPAEEAIVHQTTAAYLLLRGCLFGIHHSGLHNLQAKSRHFLHSIGPTRVAVAPAVTHTY